MMYNLFLTMKPDYAGR